MKAVRDLGRVCNDRIGESRIDFSAQSYVSLKKGRRCWLPMWPRRDGVFVYLPGGPGGQDDGPSDFFTRVADRLKPLSIEPSWSYKYNGGANPIAFGIPAALVGNSVLIDILSEAYQLA